jgi:hypothetical protein
MELVITIIVLATASGFKSVLLDARLQQYTARIYVAAKRCRT